MCIRDRYKTVPLTGEEAYSFCAYNLGSGHVKTTGEVIGLLQTLLGTNIPPVGLPRVWDAFIELPHQYLDSERVRKEIGWEATMGFKSGLNATIEWYKKHWHDLKPLYEPEIVGP